MYIFDGSLDDIKQKTTIKTFDHLNEPIVISISCLIFRNALIFFYLVF